MKKSIIFTSTLLAASISFQTSAQNTKLNIVEALDSQQSIKTVQQLSSFEVIIKWKDNRNYNSLLRTPESLNIDKREDLDNNTKLMMKKSINVINSDRSIGLDSLNEIYSNTGVLLKHIRSASMGRDLFKVTIDSGDFSEIKDKLLSTGLFKYVEENVNLSDYSKGSMKPIKQQIKTRNKKSGMVVAQDAMVWNKYNDTHYLNMTYLGEQETYRKGLSSLDKARDLYISNKQLDRKLRIAVLDSGSWSHEEMNWSTEGVDMVSLAGMYYDCQTADNINNSGNDATCTTENILTKVRDSDPTDKDWIPSASVGVDYEVCISGHGLSVASSIAARTNNNKGIVGLLDSKDIEIIPVRVLGCNGGSLLDAADGIEWAAGRTIPGVSSVISEPVDIINLSLGSANTFGCETMSSLQDSINFAVSQGVTVFVASGNDTDDVKNYIPASCDNIISVASNNKAGDISSFSNYGEHIDFSMLGEEIYTASISTGIYTNLSSQESFCTNPQGLMGGVDQCYGATDGTSIATPLALSVAGMMKIKDPSLTNLDIMSLLKNTSVPYDISENGIETQASLVGAGEGVVNAYSALMIKDNITSLEKNEVKHHYQGFSDDYHAVYIDEMKKLVPNVCNFYKASWGYLNNSSVGISYNLYNYSGSSLMNESNSTLFLETDKPFAMLDMSDKDRVGVIACSDTGCGKMYELDLSKSQKPSSCN